MSFQKAFNSFMQDDFCQAVDDSTKASYSGSGYSVELFKDDTYRVLWNKSIGNLYDSEGLILGIPSLNSEDDDAEQDLRYYDNAESAMREIFAEALNELDVAGYWV